MDRVKPVSGIQEWGKASSEDVEALSDELLDRVALRLKAMGNPLRLKILHVLEGGELPVRGIMARVGGSQANISKHLSVLRNADLVGFRREGVKVYYFVLDDYIFGVCEMVCDSLLSQASAEVDRLRRARANILAHQERV